METSRQNERAIRRCVDLFNLCTLEWVDTCYAEEAEWIELPIPGISTGRQGRRAFMREAAGRILRLYPNRQLRILNLVSQGDQVVLEQDWQGTFATTMGSLKAGDQLCFRVASFFTLLNGLIIKQTDYCIPIPPAGAVQ
jgi:ketosteroid isomerase-like protein